MENIINQLAEFWVSIYPVLYWLALISGAVFVVSGFADLFFDLYYMAYSIRRFFNGREWKPLTLERLEAREQQRIAIFIAAWQESDVIAKTLAHACQTIQYRNYDIFVGTYPNDPETQAEVNKVVKEYSHVHNVVTPENGPTNKASNLNHVFTALEDYESKTNLNFDIIVMHDSEDIIHPYSMLLYNYLIPRMDMIQIPVFPMALPLSKITHWTYADEFAENHTKNMLVREIAGGFVPSAGVGTAFTKRAFKILKQQNPQGAFSTNTLTEDYQLGLRMNLSGVKAAFVNVNIKNPRKQEKQGKSLSDWVATRAVFPTQLKRSVKQKTRWNIGIIFQGWKNLGWEGSLAVKWNLFQDRKALIATPVSFLSYLVFIYFLLYLLIARISTMSMPILIPYGSLLWYLVLGSTLFMIWRALNRAYAVNKIYGFYPALTSIPRVIWGNLINYLAVTRAVYQYTINSIRKRQVVWDKTAHEFPSEIKNEAEWLSNPEISSTTNRTIGQQSDSELKEVIHQFKTNMELGNLREKVRLIQQIPSEHGELLFPILISYISDPAWEVRAAVCRTLSFLRLPQSLPYLVKASSDQDWIVRANATRAIGKFSIQGEAALLHLLGGDDHFASDAALAILEHQGFLEYHIRNLENPDAPQKKENALRFIRTLAQTGKSQLANLVLEKYEKKTTQKLEEEKKQAINAKVKRIFAIKSKGSLEDQVKVTDKPGKKILIIKKSKSNGSRKSPNHERSSVPTSD